MRLCFIHLLPYLNHAQLLLVGTEGFNRPGTQSAAAVGTAPARAQVKIRGAELSDSLREDYAESHGRWLIPVNRKGVRQVALSHVGDTLHVALESDQKRVVEVREIAEAALLVDFLVEGRKMIMQLKLVLFQRQYKEQS